MVFSTCILSNYSICAVVLGLKIYMYIFLVIIPVVIKANWNIFLNNKLYLILVYLCINSVKTKLYLIVVYLCINCVKTKLHLILVYVCINSVNTKLYLIFVYLCINSVKTKLYLILVYLCINSVKTKLYLIFVYLCINTVLSVNTSRSLYFNSKKHNYIAFSKVTFEQ